MESAVKERHEFPQVEDVVEALPAGSTGEATVIGGASGMFRVWRREAGPRVEDRPAGPGRREVHLRFSRSGLLPKHPPGFSLALTQHQPFTGTTCDLHLSPSLCLGTRGS